MPNNRELATLVWFAVLLAWVLSMRQTRASAVGVFRAAFASRLSILWLSYVAVIAAVIWGLRTLGLRYSGSTKDAVVWALVAGLSILSKFDTLSRNQRSFGQLLRRVFGATVLVEFYVNLYVFPLWVELLLQPFVALLVGMEVVAGTRDEYAVTRRVLNGCLSFIGWVLLASVTVYLASRLPDLNTVQIGLSFVQPLALTIVVVALTYVVALYSAYEQVFGHMSFPVVPSPTSRWSKVALVRGLHFRLGKVAGFTGYLPRRLKSMRTYAEALELVNDYKRGQARPEDRPEA
ncbi:MAG TPA: hypothetical protein VNB24_09070 [Acidimicrobiales bacterium]|nr:hypothetical protein [Acidimicrobiales bacterium]